MIKKIQLITIIALLLPNFASATEIAFANANAGKFHLDASIGKGKGLKLDKDYNQYNATLKKANLFEIGAGYYIHDNISVNLSYLNSSKFHLNSSSDDVDDNHFTHDSHLKFSALMANVYYHIPLNNNFEPFIGIGLGMSRNTQSDFYITKNGAYFKNRKGDSKNNFAFGANLGTLVKFNDKLSLKLEYRYLDLGKIRTNNYYIFSDGDTDYGAVNTSKLRVHTFLIGIRYQF